MWLLTLLVLLSKLYAQSGAGIHNSEIRIRVLYGLSQPGIPIWLGLNWPSDCLFSVCSTYSFSIFPSFSAYFWTDYAFL